MTGDGGHGGQGNRHHPQRRHRADRCDAASGQRAGADPRRGRIAGWRRPHRAAPAVARPRPPSARRPGADLRHRGLVERSRRGAGQAGFCGVLRRGGHQAARVGAEQGDRRRQAHLQREAGGAVGGRGSLSITGGAGARAESRRGRGQDQFARLAEAFGARPDAVFSAESPASGSISAGGCSTAPNARASGRAGITARAAAAG